MNDQTAGQPGRWCLECQAVSVRRGGRLAVCDVSLAIRAGECVSLVGPNGSGKTTLLLALLGLLPTCQGTVRLDGREVRGLAPRVRGRFSAYVPQVLAHAPAFRVCDLVADARFPHVGLLRPLGQADRASVRAVLTRCGLSALAERPFNTLSGGEQRKALIAAALAQDPQVLFLDEPNTALDPAYQLELAVILHDWHQAGGTIVLVSHDLQLPAVLGGRMIALRDGRVVADGPVQQVLTPEVLGRVYAAPFDSLATADGNRLVLPAWRQQRAKPESPP